MTYKLIILCLINTLILCHDMNGQKHDNVWVVGYGYNILPIFDFYNGFADTSFINSNKYPDGTSSLSICDTAGYFQFFTNGKDIINKYGINLPESNQFNIYDSIDQQYFSGVRQSQGIIALPIIDSNQVYAIFHIATKNQNSRGEKLMYSLIDMNTNNGAGKMVSKNNIILDKPILFGSMQATKHANGKKWWIVVHEPNNDIFHSILLSKNGIDTIIEQQLSISASYNEYYGQSKFSPDGSLYCITRPNQFFSDLYYFDRCTGLLTIKERIMTTDTSNLYNYPLGCSFSSDNQYLYINSFIELFQYNLLQNNLSNNGISIFSYDFNNQLNYNYFGRQQLAPNGKIYLINNTYMMNNIHVINNPNLNGQNCNFIEYGQSSIWNTFITTLPEHSNYRLGSYNCAPLKIDSKENEISCSFYPNPADKLLHLKFDNFLSSQKITIRIINTQGKIIYTMKEYRLNEVNIDISTFNVGLYFIQVETAQNKLVSKFYKE